jgi:hypothetical protein
MRKRRVRGQGFFHLNSLIDSQFGGSYNGFSFDEGLPFLAEIGSSESLR